MPPLREENGISNTSTMPLIQRISWTVKVEGAGFFGIGIASTTQEHNVSDISMNGMYLFVDASIYLYLSINLSIAFYQ